MTLTPVPPVGLALPTSAPLSFAQQRLWFLSQLDPGSSAYNTSNAWRLKGPLDRVALRRTLTSIVHRHAVLRTTFEEAGDQPRQLIHPPAPVHLPVVDLQDHPLADRQAEATRVVATEAFRPFDLRRDHPVRATLVHLAPDDHVLLLCVHHIATDGWSNRIRWPAGRPD